MSRQRALALSGRGPRAAADVRVGPDEEPLDAGSRTRMERRFGESLTDVRVRRDAADTGRLGVAGFTIGSTITVDPARYRPGSVSGESLMAHEVTHVLQQRDAGAVAGNSGGQALEDEADRAAVSAATEPEGTILQTLRSALSLRSCEGCTSEEERQLSRFLEEHDGKQLADMVEQAPTDRLERLRRQTGGDALHRSAISWETAWRQRDFARLTTLVDGADEGLRHAYGQRLVAAVMNGGQTIRVSGTQGFRSAIEEALSTLANTRHGLRLLLELLATGGSVSLVAAAAGAESVTTPVDRPAASLATQVTDPNDPNIGQPLPPSQQRAGTGSGSTISLNEAELGNQVVLGGTAARRTIIAMPVAAIVGHELIHALHNALGVNIGPGIDRRLTEIADPLTGESINPEELYTIAGRTSFGLVTGADPAQMSFPTQYAVPATVTENDLRRDLGDSARASHFGALDTVQVRRGSSATLDDLVARYRLRSGPVPSEGVAVIRAMVLQRLDGGRLDQLPAETQLLLPHPSHVLLRIRFVDRRSALADRMADLEVR